MPDPVEQTLVDEIGVPLKPGGIFTKKDGTQIQIHHTNPRMSIKGHFLPGISGNTNGRTGGTRERINVQAKMMQLGCCPFTILGHIAMGDQDALKEAQPIPLSQRRYAATDLCKYLAPQRKSVDIDAKVESDSKGRTVVILPSNGRETQKDLEKLVDEDQGLIEHYPLDDD